MKKIIIPIALMLALVLAFTGCETKKKAVSVEKFTSVAEAHGLKVSDDSEDYKDDSRFTSVTSADHSDGWYVSFVVGSSVSDAKNIYENNEGRYKEEYDGSTSSKSVGNYATFKLNNDTQYVYMCRVDKTILFVDVDQKFAEEAKKIVSELGY